MRATIALTISTLLFVALLLASFNALGRAQTRHLERVVPELVAKRRACEGSYTSRSQTLEYAMLVCL
jgi:hypothetical protein